MTDWSFNLQNFYCRRNHANEKVEKAQATQLMLAFFNISNEFHMTNILQAFQGYLRYKAILCHKVALDVQLMNFFI